VGKHFGIRDVKNPLGALRVADIGCGGGILSESLARSGAEVVGVDPSPENIAIATAHAQKDPVTATIEYRASTAEDMSAAGEHFDVVCALEVVEHVSDLDLFVKSCADLVKPGGALVVSTVNRTRLSYMLGIVAASHCYWA